MKITAQHRAQRLLGWSLAHHDEPRVIRCLCDVLALDVTKVNADPAKFILRYTPEEMASWEH